MVSVVRGDTAANGPGANLAANRLAVWKADRSSECHVNSTDREFLPRRQRSGAWLHHLAGATRRGGHREVPGSFRFSIDPVVGHGATHDVESHPTRSNMRLASGVRLPFAHGPSRCVELTTGRRTMHIRRPRPLRATWIALPPLQSRDRRSRQFGHLLTPPPRPPGPLRRRCFEQVPAVTHGGLADSRDCCRRFERDHCRLPKPGS